MSFDYDYDDENHSDHFQAVYQCYSAAFLNDRERNSIENGGKILLPQKALEQLINQTGIMLFKLKNLQYNRETHCGVLEFLPNNDPICYLPHWIMKHLLLEEGDNIHIESIDSLPSATFVRFEPQSKTFLDITNPRAVLEKFLRNFNCLTKGDLISINYLNHNYDLFVVDLKPSNIVSIIECDIEVDFTLPIDSKSVSTNINQQQISTTLMPFLNRLNVKNESNNQEEKIHFQKRGLPNYDYKYGLLQFPRNLNNETKEKSSSNIFQPFTGEGKVLRQPRNQRSK